MFDEQFMVFCLLNFAKKEKKNNCKGQWSWNLNETYIDFISCFFFSKQILNMEINVCVLTIIIIFFIARRRIEVTQWI